MYEFKKAVRKLILFVPFILLTGLICLLFGAFGQAFAIILFVIAGQLLLIFGAGEYIRRSEKKGGKYYYEGLLSLKEKTRRDIVRDFSKKNYINLRDEQVNLIV